jgi:RNA polymerase sigma factor FliA
MKTSSALKPPRQPLQGYQARNRAVEERERLILEHLPQVWFIARRIHKRLPQSVSVEDLVSAGTIGLIVAIDRFNPQHNVKLQTYAEHRIRGAILDSLRSLDWAPREPRKRSKLIEAAITLAERRFQRVPTEPEVADELGLTLSKYREWRVGLSALNLVSLEAGSPEDDSLNLVKYISNDEEKWPSRLLERSECQRLLNDAIEEMPRIERVVISLYYHEELTLREIAKIFSLHESRVSQLKSRGILRLRSHMEKLWPVPRGLDAQVGLRLKRPPGRPGHNK